MEKIAFKAMKRDVSTKGMLKKLRSEGFIPGIVYGKTAKPIPVAINEKEFINIIKHKGTSVIVNLDINGTTYFTILKDIQKDPFGDKIVHVDFLEVDLNKSVFTKIPIVVVGESKGVKVGGVLEHTLYDIKVEAAPLDIPDKIEVDVTELDINDVVHVSDLVLSDKVKVLTSLDTVVVGIGHPTKEEEVPVEVEAGEETGEEAGEEAGEKEQKEEAKKE
ncbi:MAG: hypothetical protein DRI33_00090 [Caldiserica bacterium]|nr:MAG: hypothetical protein DRI33_00090 [Caldisericota bacterium]